MLPHFTEEPPASAEVWQLPVVVASDITADEGEGEGGRDGRGGFGPGEQRVEKQ